MKKSSIQSSLGGGSRKWEGYRLDFEPNAMLALEMLPSE